MFDNFPPIPDAVPLPFYPLVLKLVVCVLIATCYCSFDYCCSSFVISPEDRVC